VDLFLINSLHFDVDCEEFKSKDRNADESTSNIRMYRNKVKTLYYNKKQKDSSRKIRNDEV